MAYQQPVASLTKDDEAEGETNLATWDVFHADRLEVVRGLSTAAVREGLAKGDLRDDDLIRPAGTTVPWTPIADFADLTEPEPEPEPEPAPPSAFLRTEEMTAERASYPDELDPSKDDIESVEILDDSVEEYADDYDEGFPSSSAELISDDLQLVEDDDDSVLALPVVEDEAPGYDQEEEFDPQDEDEEAAEFTLSRGGPERVEELDLAAMVDVAFQLVLFFLVTATTVLYKSLEVPKPNPDSPTAGAQQGRSRSLDDLKNDYILVEIDPAGVMKIDREPVASEMDAVVERLRAARASTKRQAMLLTADFATPHRSAVMAYDAANEIGLGIAIARPSGPDANKAPPAPATKKAAKL